MGAARAAFTARVSHRSSPTAPTADNPQRDFLSIAYGRSMALSAPGMAAVADGLPLLPPLATGWDVGTNAHGAARAGAHPPRTTSPAQRGLDRQPVGEDDRRWRGPGLRWRQEARRAQAPRLGGYGGTRAGAQRPFGRDHGSRWHKTRPHRGDLCPVAPHATTLAGCGLQRAWQGEGLGRADHRLDRGDRERHSLA